jgi:hypothetical protein
MLGEGVVFPAGRTSSSAADSLGAVRSDSRAKTLAFFPVPVFEKCSTPLPSTYW